MSQNNDDNRTEQEAKARSGTKAKKPADKKPEAKKPVVKKPASKAKAPAQPQAQSASAAAPKQTAAAEQAAAPEKAATAPSVALEAASGSGVANLEVPQKLTPAEVSALVAAKQEAAAQEAAAHGSSEDAVAVPSDAENKQSAAAKAAADQSKPQAGGEDVVTAATDDTKDKVVGTFPLVTLRSIIITPAANVQLIAARESTALALEEALASTKGVAVFSQLVEVPGGRPNREDLSRIGVLARVLNGSYNEKEQYRATIRGYQRICIRRIIDDPARAVRHVEVEFLNELEVDALIEQRYVEALRSALDTALEVQNRGGRNIVDKTIPSEMLTSIREQSSLSLMTDGLAQILLLPYFDKKYVLESLDPVARAKAIIAYLNNFSYKAEVDKKIAEDARSAMERSQRDFYLNEQLKAIKRELNMHVDDSNDIEEYRNKLQGFDAPIEVINRLQKEISRLAVMSVNSGENSMVRNYIDTLFSIPWHVSTPLNRDLQKAKEILESQHYGLEKVKDRILEFLAVQTRKEKTQDANGQILCLMGPPGIGKTSLAASIAQATGRKYVRVALGGMYDESEIRGHRRTYIGAMPGRIIQNMIKCEANNPLFLLDEIDKVSGSTQHGDISAALLEVLDPEQNKSFNDNYVDLEYDLSHVLFIATANSYNIPPALRDRMEIIDLSSYTADEKFHIAREHLLPKQLNKNGLTPEEFDISDAGLNQLILHYTLEAGVRSLERIIAELCRKVVKDLMINPPKKPKKVVLGVKEIEKLIGPKRYDFTSKLKENRVGVVNGLSVSSYGGDMLQVEVVANEGKGSHLLTGQLGSVMKESVFAAIAWVRSHARSFNLAPDFYQNVDLNVHFPEGAIKKDGPSAGTATVTAITSALTGNPVRADVAMTGEITLRGDVLPIGGLKEKLLAALRGGVKTVCIPHENEKDLWDIPKKVTKNLNIVPVKTIDEVLDIALEFKPKEFMPTTMEEWTLSGYEKREKQRKLRMEAEEHKNYMEIRDGSDSSVKALKNEPDDAEDAPVPDKKRKGRKPKDADTPVKPEASSSQAPRPDDAKPEATEPQCSRAETTGVRLGLISHDE